MISCSCQTSPPSPTVCCLMCDHTWCHPRVMTLEAGSGSVTASARTTAELVDLEKAISALEEPLSQPVSPMQSHSDLADDLHKDMLLAATQTDKAKGKEKVKEESEEEQE